MMPSKTVTLLKVAALLLTSALMGCTERQQVDYSSWKDVEPDVECVVPPIVIRGRPVTIPQLDVVTKDVIRFSGAVERDSNGKDLGASLSVEIVKRTGKQITTLNGGSVAVAFSDADLMQYELFVKTPKPGTYSIRVSLDGSECGHGKIIIRRKK